MVKHVILWKLKEEFSAEEKQQIKAGIKEGLEGLAGQIPGMTEIKVNIETKALLCIANGTKHNVKIQITSMANDKREIRVEPDVVVLKKGEGCEFSIYIKPLCTCSDNDNDKLAIVYQVLDSKSESGQEKYE